MSINSVHLSCASCGAGLEITENLERFSCSYCGAEQIVKRSGGTVSLALTVEKLDGIKEGVNKTASELAINRLKDDIFDLEKGKSDIIADKESSVNSMRFFAKILIFIGLIGLLGLFEFLSERTTTSLLFIIPGTICSIVALMIFRSSVIYSNQSDDKLKKIDAVINKKEAEINIYLDEVKLGN